MYRIIKISLFLLLIISAQGLFGQTTSDKIPNGIAIQSVARDASGNAASNRNIYLKVELRQGSATGESVLLESHQVISNDEGIFNFYIGQGIRISGINSLIFLDWKGKMYFLNIKMAIEPSLPTPGWVLEKEYVDLGTSQIWSVPYAFTSYRSVVADSAASIAGILPASQGGTGINNMGKKIILGGDLETKGTGNLTFKTSGTSIIELPTSGKMVTNNSVDTLYNKYLMSPMLLGEPKSITPNVGSNDNTIATTNFVNVLLASDSNSINKKLSQFENSSKDSLDKKLNIKDTALMLLPYLKYIKTSDTTYADLNIKANTIIDSNLTVQGNLILNKGLRFNDSLLVSSGARIDSSLLLKGKLFLRDSLLVNGNSLIDSNLTVGKDLEIKGNLILNRGLDFNDSLIVQKGARIEQSILAKSKLYVSDSILAKGNVKIDNNLNVIGKSTLADSLLVKGNSLIDSNLTVGKDLEVKGNLILNTGLKFNDSLIVTKGARIDSSLILKGKLLLRDSLVASGNGLIKGVAQLDSTLTVNKNVNFRDSLFVKGQVKLDSNVYIRGNFRLGGDLILDSGLFRENHVVNLGEGVKFGRYNYKDTIYTKGKSIDKVFYDILTDITHPLYIAPKLKISKLLDDPIDATSTNKILRYEIGKNLGSLKFSSNFVQNNAGAILSTKYKRDTTVFSYLPEGTDTINNLIDTLYYTSTILYDHGAILTNRIGLLDSTGRINSGIIISDSISIFPVSKNYWGYIQSADSLNITDSLLLGKDTSINNKGFSDFGSSPYKSSFSIPIAGGEKYIYYAYPATYPDLTSVMVGPFESVDAFTKIIRNVVNAEGYSQPYKIYVSANNFSDKVEKIIIDNNIVN